MESFFNPLCTHDFYFLCFSNLCWLISIQELWFPTKRIFESKYFSTKILWDVWGSRIRSQKELVTITRLLQILRLILFVLWKNTKKILYNELYLRSTACLWEGILMAGELIRNLGLRYLVSYLELPNHCWIIHQTHFRFHFVHSSLGVITNYNNKMKN